MDILGRCDRTYRVSGYFKDLLVNYYDYAVRGLVTDKIFRKLELLGRSKKNMFVRNCIYRVRHFIYRHGYNYERRMYKYFSTKMAGVDYIVVDGAGLLEYSYNEYQEPLRIISRYAEKHHLEVVYNAIGRAGAFDERDFRSKILKQALRSPVVKYVSARDSVETVQLCAGEDKKVELLADAAFWMKDAYHLPEPQERKKIGIGIVRGNSLSGYGTNFTAENWVSLFSDIAKLLKKRGYEYEFFTNGLYGDIVLGNKILDALGLPPEYLVTRPVDDEVLYSTINGYAGIITCRMHSSIAAFTQGIPSIILSWNDKVEKLMEIIGYPERAIKFEQFDGKYIVDKFEEALKEGVAQEKIDAMRAKAMRSVDGYADRIYEEILRRNHDEDDDVESADEEEMDD